MSQLEAALSRIPQLAGRPAASLQVERLGGLTNLNFKIVAGDEAFVLRIPGEGTSAYIDRGAEEENARLAAAAGVNADVVFFDAGDGLQLTRFIAGAITMNANRFRDLGSVARAARAFRRMHSSGRPFANSFELFAKMDEYLAYLHARKARIPDGYERVQREAETVRAALAARPAMPAPCHCDPLAENFLDTGERIYIV